MRILFISSGNAGDSISPIVLNQGESLIERKLLINFFPIKGKGFLPYFKHILILRKYRHNNKFDLFHAHYSLSAFVATLAGCRPLIVSLMGSDTKCSIFLKKIIQILAKRRWSTVIVKSASMKNDIGIDKAVIIPNGVDLRKVVPGKIEKNNQDKKIILFAADPRREVKNYYLAEKAVLLLENKNVVLKVVHSKPYSEILAEINNSDLVLLTSLWEGSPNIIKEAMACNCPIVATDVGDVKSIIGNTEGCYLTSFDPADVAEKIKSALNFGKKSNGRQRIIDLKLDSASIAARIMQTYEVVLNYGRK